jgi:hypothetical protein
MTHEKELLQAHLLAILEDCERDETRVIRDETEWRAGPGALNRTSGVDQWAKALKRQKEFDDAFISLMTCRHFAMSELIATYDRDAPE